MVIGIALAFPTGFIVFLDNIKVVSSNLDNTSELNLFLKMDVNEIKAEALADKLSNHEDIKKIIFNYAVTFPKIDFFVSLNKKIILEAPIEDELSKDKIMLLEIDAN